MRRTMWGSAAVAIALAVGGCSSSNPVASVPDHTGNNTPITADNADYALQEMYYSLTTAYLRAFHAGQGTTVAGDSSGTMQVKSQSGTKIAVEFTDYSDDNFMWFGGTLTMEVTTGTTTTTTLDGQLAVSGFLKGTVDVSVTVSGNHVTGTLKVDGTDVPIDTNV